MKNSPEYERGESVYDLFMSGMLPRELIGERFVCVRRNYYLSRWDAKLDGVLLVGRGTERQGKRLLCQVAGINDYTGRLCLDLGIYIDWAHDTFILKECDYEYEEL